MSQPVPAVPATPRVVPVHTSCRERVRLEVHGLYQMPSLKRRLEAALGGTGGIGQASASTVTGRLLVCFAAPMTLPRLVALVDELLGDPAAAQPRPCQVGQRDYPQSPALAGFTALLRGLGRLVVRPFAQPALGALAGAAPAAQPRALEAQPIRAWFAMALTDVEQALATPADTGLTLDAVGERLRRFGHNALTAAETRSNIAIFVSQFNSLPVGLLAVSAGVAVATGGLLDAAVILGVVMINGVIGFVTERQAERTIESLTQTGARSVKALRGGETVTVPVEDIVPGDVLLLAPGDYIAADIRLLRAHRLSVDESALTGESLPVSKDPDFIAKDDTPLGDRLNMAYMGTHVTGGNGRGMVVATAAATELGQIQTMVGEAESPETPMQKQLGRMGTQLALLSGGVCAGVFGVGVLRGYAWLEMLKASVSLAVAAVPEGLPAVATTTLAMGINDMRRRNVAVRHLDAVETLGSVQVFCMDKTGTLTMNRMAVVAVYGGGERFKVAAHKLTDDDGHAVDPLEREELVRLMQVVSLCSEAEIKGVPGKWQFEGSPTENALVELAVEAGIDVPALRAERPRLKTRYRAEGRPYMSSLHPYKDGKHLLAVKGSPDEVLALCTTMLRDGKKVRLTKAMRAEITNENQRMAGQALRVLGAAYRELDEGQMPDKTGQLCWLGLAGMADPMRPGMDRLIAEYHQAGIETIMITGDQSATAYAIGKELGLSGEKPLQVLESNKLEEMDPELLAGLVRNVHVFARVSPAHKLKIVRALQEAGMVVAMTGDGINDGPALKAADIGVAMGESGTNVAREVSDVVLEDDNLHTMTIAVAQGRTIYNNIRKMIHFMVSTNLTEIEVMLAGVMLGWGEAMNPMQLLWINLVTDIFPGLALSMEPAEPDIMDRPPRDPEEAIITREDLKRMTFESGMIGLGTAGAFIYGMRRYGLGPAPSTLAFNTLVMNELTHALSSRSRYRNVFGGEKLAPNKHLTRAVLGMAALQVVVSVVPGARRLLGTVPLGWMDLAAIGAGVILPLIVNEATKPRYRGPEHAAVLEMEPETKPA
ncbi:HAD-IC family P-type ATPase [uncultured Thiohalocapsa sp.]|uniref:cation-translocating P-type ATPase n=1 Tax=uncultured Thiohalocapsa sp. TaxID=768990 RepID=UPI0025FFA81D|nr:HAD-IC family P-type ATPase [uncultured Thiohalocapsa sp.]